MAGNIAGFALDGGDPRGNDIGEGTANYSPGQMKGLHDPSVSFEEYLHYAQITRADQLNPPQTSRALTGLKNTFNKHKRVSISDPTKEKVLPEDSKSVSPSVDHSPTKTPEFAKGAAVSDEEWYRASRAMRTATWGSVSILLQPMFLVCRRSFNPR